jgi:hypothetical protein
MLYFLLMFQGQNKLPFQHGYAGIRVPTRQITEFSTFGVSSALTRQ